MIRRSTLLALEIVLGLAAALIIGLGVAWWRLSQGPVELNFIRQHVQVELSSARAGRPVGIERVELAWSRAGNALELRAVGVTIEDGHGAVLSRASEARIELGVLPLLWGHISLRRADFSGGELSVTRRIDGAVLIAFGPPGAAPDIIVPPPPPNEALAARVNRLLDGLEAAFRPIGVGGRLQTISVRGAKLAIIDEAGGGRWTADDASLELARSGGALAFAARARLEGGEGQAPASLRVTTDTRFQTAIVEFGAENVRPRALLSPAALGPFAGLDAPLTATVSIGLDRTVGINRLEGEATLGRGTADMAGGRFSLDGGSVRGRYDIDTDVLIIDQLRLAGDHTRIQGEVRVRDASAILRAAPGQPAAFNISFPALAFDAPDTFSEPVSFAGVEIVGAIVSGERSVRFDRIHARTEAATIDAAGRFYWAEAGPERRIYPGVELTGAVVGALGVQDVMQLWPMGLAEGAREYLVESLIAGRVSDVHARLDIRPSDMAAEALRNEAIDVRFNVADAEVRFIDTMSPVTHARGSAVLQGNRFDMAIPEARINGLAVTNGRVEIPRLKPKGALATISARAEGDARHMVELLAQEPLHLGDRLPLDVATVTGHGAVNLRIQRPMLSEVPFENWRFNVDGQIDNFAGNMSTRQVALSQGRLLVRGDQRVINVSGPIRAGGSAVNISWNEYLNRPAQASSEYEISGDFETADLVRLGYTIARYAEGRLGVTVSGAGRGFDVDNAEIEVDLRGAAVDSPWHFWTKRAGVAATARFDVARQADGSLNFTNIDGRGAGLVVQGRTRVARDGAILELDLPRLALEGRSDAHVLAQRASDGGLDVRVTGALFDGAPFMGDDGEDAAGVAGGAHMVEAPLRAHVQVAALKLRGGATLQNARVEVQTQRGALTMLTAEGRSPGNLAFSLGLGVRPADPQGRLRFRGEDAGFAARALTGSENVVGGTASADGDWRPGPPTSARFNVALRDFQVVRMPAMTRLLSSAGSLRGLVEMLNGDGIGMSALDASAVYANNRLSFREARMTGPSLGLTASGSYDMERDNLDVDGVIAPSPTLNLAMLGGIPVIGDLLVSRRGEGVFGMTYSINGHVAEPRVGVNPVSALTPGILRRIFEPLQRSQPAPVAEAPAPPAAALPVGEGDASAP